MFERYAIAGQPDVGHGQRAPVVTMAGETRALRWGLLRRWTGHGGKRGPNIYTARVADTAAMPLLRDARAQQRCAVLVDGYHARAGLLRAGRVVALPGVWATSRDDDEPSFAILDAGAAIPGYAIDRDAWLARGELIADPVSWRLNPAQGELF